MYRIINFYDKCDTTFKMMFSGFQSNLTCSLSVCGFCSCDVKINCDLCVFKTKIHASFIKCDSATSS